MTPPMQMALGQGVSWSLFLEGKVLELVALPLGRISGLKKMSGYPPIHNAVLSS